MFVLFWPLNKNDKAAFFWISSALALVSDDSKLIDEELEFEADVFSDSVVCCRGMALSVVVVKLGIKLKLL